MRDCTSFKWTDERCEQLTALWASGLSAKEVALELGGSLSRSSVIGKVHRLNLPVREQDKRRPRVGPRQPRQRKPYVRKTINGCAPFQRAPVRPLPVPVIDDHKIPLEQRKSLWELTDKTCRFPVGDPDIEGFFFCGAEPLTRQPYCAAHCARAYDQRALQPLRHLAKWVGWRGKVAA